MSLSTTKSPSILGSQQNSGAGVQNHVTQLLTQARTSGSPDLFTATGNMGKSLQDQVNYIMQALRKPLPVPQDYYVLDPTGKLVAWIGNRTFDGKAFQGGAFSNVWIGPGADPTTAPFFSNGSQVVIGQNGAVSVQDASQAEKGFIGIRFDAAINITSISNATPPVVQTAAAHGYTTGDTVTIAGDSISSYNGQKVITVVDATHFRLNGGTAAGAGSGGTSTRYFAGVWAQTAAFSGTGFGNATIKAQADGSVIIGNSTTNMTVSPSGAVTLNGVGLDLVNGTKSVVIDPTVPDIVLSDSSVPTTMTLNPTTGIVTVVGTKQVQWNSSVPDIVLSDSSIPSTLTLDPTNGSVFNAHGVNTAISNAAGFGPSGTMIGGLTVTDNVSGSQFAIVPGGFQLKNNPTSVTQPGLFPGGSGYTFACDNIGGINFTIANLQLVQVLAASATAGAATLPAAPAGFFLVKDLGGTVRKVPAYNF